MMFSLHNDSAMLAQRKPKGLCGWLRFSLRTLLAAVGVLAVVLSAWLSSIRPDRREREAVAALRRFHADITTEAAAPKWLSGWIGDTQRVVAVHIWGDRVLHPKKGLVAHFGITFRDEDLAHLKSLPALRHLSLPNTRISDEGLKAIAELDGLDGLSLHGTAITDAGLPHLKKLSRLRELAVSDTAVTAAGFAELKNAAPAVQRVMAVHPWSHSMTGRPFHAGCAGCVRLELAR